MKVLVQEMPELKRYGEALTENVFNPAMRQDLEALQQLPILQATVDIKHMPFIELVTPARKK